MEKVTVCNVDNGDTKIVSPNYDIRKNFKVRELISRDCEVVLYSGLLLDVAQAVREHYNLPVQFSNLFRTLTHNKDVGGSETSNHPHGKATDMYIWGVDAENLKKVVSRIAGHFSQIITYKKTNHVHVAVNVEHERLYHNGDIYIKVEF